MIVELETAVRNVKSVTAEVRRRVEAESGVSPVTKERLIRLREELTDALLELHRVEKELPVRRS